MAKDTDGTDLPRSVYYVKGGRVKPYKVLFNYIGERMSVGFHLTPALASAAYERKRLELGADLLENDKKESRHTPPETTTKKKRLPQGVTFVTHKARKAKPYMANFRTKAGWWLLPYSRPRLRSRQQQACRTRYRSLRVDRDDASRGHPSSESPREGGA